MQQLQICKHICTQQHIHGKKIFFTFEQNTEFYISHFYLSKDESVPKPYFTTI